MTEWGALLPPDFYERDAHELARALLGQVLVSEAGGVLTAGRLVEVEVYGGVDDAACHADRGVPTDRTRSMFGAPGTLYVYRIYGMYDCANVVAPRGRIGKASAVLVRAVEPLAGIEAMVERRAGAGEHNLTSGPGKLCQALGISRGLDGHWLQDSPVGIHHGDTVDQRTITCSPRIGLNEKTCGVAASFDWRYCLPSAHLSR